MDKLEAKINGIEKRITEVEKELETLKEMVKRQQVEIKRFRDAS